MNIEEVVTAPRSPWQNPYVERIIGSIRRECLDYVIIFNEAHLRRVLSSYFRYTTSPELILRLTKIARGPARYLHPPPAKSSPSRKSAVCTIGMNVEQREIHLG